ncbi:MAG: hypothetical protein AAB768_00675 [Patescibacteria group bacterium]
MRKTHSYDRDIVALLVITLVTLSSWVGFEVYRAFTNTNIPDVSARLMRPLDPALNTALLSALKSRLP